MELRAATTARTAEIIDLFTATFTASEGADEGALIGGLVRDLLRGTTHDDRFVFCAEQDGATVGAIVFSRLIYADDERSVFVLAPVAVAPAHQGRGIGQRLLNHGLAVLRHAGVDVVMTYGDPNYYARVGFQSISETDAPAPFPLHHPEGWLAQPLRARQVAPLPGPCRCVEALNDPVFW